MKSLEPRIDEEDKEMMEQVEKLKVRLKECQKLGKYVEAQMAQNRIAELREKLAETQIDKLKLRQEKEMQDLRECQEAEKAEVETKWQNSLHELDAECQAEEDKMLERHTEEQAAYRVKSGDKIPEKAHLSQELVELKKREEALAKQGKYSSSPP